MGLPPSGHIGLTQNGQSPSPKQRIHPIGNKDSLSQHFQQFNIKNLTPQVPELTPTNSKGKFLKTIISRRIFKNHNFFFSENIFECSSETSCDDFASLHSTGNHFNRSKRPNFKPPEGKIFTIFLKK